MNSSLADWFIFMSFFSDGSLIFLFLILTRSLMYRYGYVEFCFHIVHSYFMRLFFPQFFFFSTCVFITVNFSRHFLSPRLVYFHVISYRSRDVTWVYMSSLVPDRTFTFTRFLPEKPLLTNKLYVIYLFPYENTVCTAHSHPPLKHWIMIGIGFIRGTATAAGTDEEAMKPQLFLCWLDACVKCGR